MLIVSPIILQGLSLFVSVSIFYVWVVRYQNIIAEFKEYGIPEGLRDLVGILKLFFCACLLTKSPLLMLFASLAMMGLMAAAVAMHLKVKHAIHKMVPSITLLTVFTLIFLNVSA